jgi:hypothetical protein
MCETFPHEADNFRHNPPSCVVFQSEFQRARLSLQYQLWGVPPEKQFLIRGAFDPSEFAFQPAAHKLGDPFMVGRIARDHPSKWPSRISGILSAVRDNGIDVRGSYLGWRTALEKFSGPLPSFCHANPPSKIPSTVFYKDLHCLLCTGDCSENWPRVTLEAMAAGVPVMADAHSGYREQIQHGATGLLCENEEDFADGLLRLSQDETYRLQIAANAREALRQLADPEEIGGKWRRVFAEI